MEELEVGRWSGGLGERCGGDVEAMWKRSPEVKGVGFEEWGMLREEVRGRAFGGLGRRRLCGGVLARSKTS